MNGKRVETKAKFRAYNNRYESFVDHGKLISENKTYSEAMKHTGDANQMIDDIADAGYATDPKYATNLKWIARTFDLYKVDTFATPLKDLVKLPTAG